MVQVDVEPDAIGAHRPIDLALVADAGLAADALSDELERRGHRATGFRTAELADQIAANGWADDPYEDLSTGDWIDPRTLSLELERRLPADKLVVTDSGHSLGYPAMFLSVPDARSWVFPNGFQAVGLGLGSAIGAAIARPDVPTVAALGDGGTFMALAEIETAVRLGLKLLVCIYDDSAYGAEVHHFAPLGHDVGLVRFPDADLAAIARAAGAQRGDRPNRRRPGRRRHLAVGRRRRVRWCSMPRSTRRSAPSGWPRPFAPDKRTGEACQPMPITSRR